jgi:hypothetical protein
MILVIRSARPSVLDDFLRHRSTASPVTVLEVASGAPAVQRWEEIVVLHNQGNDSYVPIYWLAARAAGWRTPFRIYYQNGTEQLYRSVVEFAARRVPLVLAGTIVVAVLIIAARLYRGVR